MIKIKISTASNEHDLIKQTPGSKGVWGNCKFYINDDVEECDFWVVYDNLSGKEKTKCPPSNTILITGEPPTIKKYNQKFINQFATIITCHKDIKHQHAIQTQQALPWWIGYRFNDDFKTFERKNPENKGYNELKNTNNVKKEKLISIITSNKNWTNGHAKRLIFVQELKKYYGDKIEIFGKGINEVRDKWDAISPYKYHIVLENCVHENYWTEKLTDTFLSQSYPIYYGCPNINNYFSKESLTAINIDNPHESIKTIDNIINNNQYEKSIDKIKEAKNLILDKYNLFPMLHNFCKHHKNTDTTKKEITLYHEIFFNSLLSKIKKFIIFKKSR